MRVQLLATILEPFIPTFSDKVFHQLNLDHFDIPDTFAIDIGNGHEIGEPAPLFRTITPEEVAYFRGKYGTGSTIASSPTPGSAAAAATAASGASAKPGDKKGGKPAAAGGKKPSAAPERAEDDISRLDLRVGKIVKVWPHESADKLYCEEVRGACLSVDLCLCVCMWILMSWNVSVLAD